MAQRIVIKNFRQITHVDIEIKNITVLIGENASGKSTVAKLVYFFKCLGKSIVEDLTIGKKNDTVQNEIFNSHYFFVEFKEKYLQHKIAELFLENFGNSLLDDFEITYFFEGNHENFNKSDIFINRITADNFNLKGVNITITKIKGKIFCTLGNDKDYCKLSVSHFFLNSKLNFGNFYSLLYLIFDVKEDSCIYFPEDRLITTKYNDVFRQYFSTNLSKQFESENIEFKIIEIFLLYCTYLKTTIHQHYNENLEFDNKKVKKITDSFFKEKINFLLKGKYRNDGINEYVENINGLKILLSENSSGQKSIIRILQDIAILMRPNDLQKKFRVYEEPEANLFPESIFQLIQLIIYANNYTKSDFLITTHSPYILSSINLLIFGFLKINAENIKDFKKKIGNKISEQCFLNPNSFKAYILLETKTGIKSKMINDKNTGLITEDALDEISMQQAEIFEILKSF